MPRTLDTDEVAMVVDWQEAKKQLDFWKERERELRDAIVDFAVPTGEVGTHSFECGGGAKLKIKLANKAELDKSAGANILPAVWHNLIEAGLTADEASALVKTEQKLSEGAYNKLSANMQKIMGPIVTIKNVAPVLEIEVKKAKA